jgi:hypothetical protein
LTAKPPETLPTGAQFGEGREAEVAEPAPVRLDAESVLAGPPLAGVAPTHAGREAERAGYLEEAERIADGLEERWKREPPLWNQPTGREDVDALVWFRYVETEGL